MTKHWLAGALIACALILFDGRNSTAADNKATRVAYPSAAASFIPLWAANDAGFFKKANLAVELVAIRSSPIAMTALLSGEVDVVVGGANPSISMQLQGYKDVVLFGGLFNTFLCRSSRASGWASPGSAGPMILPGAIFCANAVWTHRRI